MTSKQCWSLPVPGTPVSNKQQNADKSSKWVLFSGGRVSNIFIYIYIYIIHIIYLYISM